MTIDPNVNSLLYWSAVLGLTGTLSVIGYLTVIAMERTWGRMKSYLENQFFVLMIVFTFLGPIIPCMLKYYNQPKEVSGPLGYYLLAMLIIGIVPMVIDRRMTQFLDWVFRVRR